MSGSSEDFRLDVTWWAMQHNLGLVLRHFDRMEAFIRDSIDPSERGAKAAADLACRFEAANAILLTCAYVSEALHVVVMARGLEPAPLSEWRNPLDAYTDHLEALGIDRSGKRWQSLKDGFEVRNCLLHGNGRMSMRPDGSARRLRSLMDRHPGVAVHLDRVVVERSFVEDVVAAAAWLVHGVLDSP